MNDNDAPFGSPAYLIKLADCIEENDETMLGPTDSHYAAVALRLYAEHLDTSIPSPR